MRKGKHEIGALSGRLDEMYLGVIDGLAGAPEEESRALDSRESLVYVGY